MRVASDGIAPSKKQLRKPGARVVSADDDDEEEGPGRSIVVNAAAARGKRPGGQPPPTRTAAHLYDDDDEGGGGSSRPALSAHKAAPPRTKLAHPDAVPAGGARKLARADMPAAAAPAPSSSSSSGGDGTAAQPPPQPDFGAAGGDGGGEYSAERMRALRAAQAYKFSPSHSPHGDAAPAPGGPSATLAGGASHTTASPAPATGPVSSSGPVSLGVLENDAEAEAEISRRAVLAKAHRERMRTGGGGGGGSRTAMSTAATVGAAAATAAGAWKGVAMGSGSGSAPAPRISLIGAPIGGNLEEDEEGGTSSSPSAASFAHAGAAAASGGDRDDGSFIPLVSSSRGRRGAAPAAAGSVPLSSSAGADLRSLASIDPTVTLTMALPNLLAHPQYAHPQQQQQWDSQATPAPVEFGAKGGSRYEAIAGNRGYRERGWTTLPTSAAAVAAAASAARPLQQPPLTAVAAAAANFNVRGASPHMPTAGPSAALYSAPLAGQQPQRGGGITAMPAGAWESEQIRRAAAQTGGTGAGGFASIPLGNGVPINSSAIPQQRAVVMSSGNGGGGGGGYATASAPLPMFSGGVDPSLAMDRLTASLASAAAAGRGRGAAASRHRVRCAADTSDALAAVSALRGRTAAGAQAYDFYADLRSFLRAAIGCLREKALLANAWSDACSAHGARVCASRAEGRQRAIAEEVAEALAEKLQAVPATAPAFAAATAAATAAASAYGSWHSVTSTSTSTSATAAGPSDARWATSTLITAPPPDARWALIAVGGAPLVELPLVDVPEDAAAAAADGVVSDRAGAAADRAPSPTVARKSSAVMMIDGSAAAAAATDDGVDEFCRSLSSTAATEVEVAVGRAAAAAASSGLGYSSSSRQRDEGEVEVGGRSGLGYSSSLPMEQQDAGGGGHAGLGFSSTSIASSSSRSHAGLGFTPASAPFASSTTGLGFTPASAGLGFVGASTAASAEATTHLPQQQPTQQQQQSQQEQQQASRRRVRFSDSTAPSSSALSTLDGSSNSSSTTSDRGDGGTATTDTAADTDTAAASTSTSYTAAAVGGRSDDSTALVSTESSAASSSIAVRRRQSNDEIVRLLLQLHTPDSDTSASRSSSSSGSLPPISTFEFGAAPRHACIRALVSGHAIPRRCTPATATTQVEVSQGTTTIAAAASAIIVDARPLNFNLCDEDEDCAPLLHADASATANDGDAALANAAGLLFADTLPDYAAAGPLLDRLSAWKATGGPPPPSTGTGAGAGGAGAGGDQALTPTQLQLARSYVDSFAFLSVRELLAPFVTAQCGAAGWPQLQPVNRDKPISGAAVSLEAEMSLDQFEWFNALWRFGGVSVAAAAGPDGRSGGITASTVAVGGAVVRVDAAAAEAEASDEGLLPRIVRETVLPMLCARLRSHYDPYSPASTARATTAVREVLLYEPDEASVRELMSAVADVLQGAVNSACVPVVEATAAAAAAVAAPSGSDVSGGGSSCGSSGVGGGIPLHPLTLRAALRVFALLRSIGEWEWALARPLLTRLACEQLVGTVLMPLFEWAATAAEVEAGADYSPSSASASPTSADGARPPRRLSFFGAILASALNALPPGFVLSNISASLPHSAVVVGTSGVARTHTPAAADGAAHGAARSEAIESGGSGSAAPQEWSRLTASPGAPLHGFAVLCRRACDAAKLWAAAQARLFSSSGGGSAAGTAGAASAASGFAWYAVLDAATVAIVQ